MFYYKQSEQDKIKECSKTIDKQCKKLEKLIKEECPVENALKTTSELMNPKKKVPKKEELDGNEEVVLNQEHFLDWRTCDIIH